MRRHAEQRAQSHHPGAPDAGNDDPVGLIEQRCRRRRKLSKTGSGISRSDCQLARLTAAYRNKAWTKPLEAGEILVAAGLVDAALAAQRRFERLNRDAARLLRAVAASFAHGLIDEDARARIGVITAFAPAPLLCSTRLIIDQD